MDIFFFSYFFSAQLFISVLVKMLCLLSWLWCQTIVIRHGVRRNHVKVFVWVFKFEQNYWNVTQHAHTHSHSHNDQEF